MEQSVLYNIVGYVFCSLLVAFIGRSRGAIAFVPCLLLSLVLTPVFSIVFFILFSKKHKPGGGLTISQTLMNKHCDTRDERIEKEMQRLDYFLRMGFIDQGEYVYLKEFVYKTIK